MNYQDEERVYAFWLSNIPGVGDVTIHKLLELAGNARNVFENPSLWERAMKPGQYQKMLSHTKGLDLVADYETFCEKAAGQGIRLLFEWEEDFPSRLRAIPDPPYALYVRGALPGEHLPGVAVVGARECSEYGKYVASAIGAALGRAHIPLISGMARGIDGISQEASLEAGGESFGVLGCGVDVCYPLSNKPLYDRLCERGGVISTFPLGTEAKPNNFPPRNRIVSGLADILIVVEARKKSGTLITVDMALEQGKDVYVVPGRITDRPSDGCNRLLKQGAGVFLSPEDFLAELVERFDWLAVGEQKVENGPMNVSETEENVYRVLTLDPMSVEQIIERLGEGNYSVAKPADLLAALMGLTVKGYVSQLSPGYFAVKRESRR